MPLTPRKTSPRLCRRLTLLGTSLRTAILRSLCKSWRTRSTRSTRRPSRTGWKPESRSLSQSPELSPPVRRFRSVKVYGICSAAVNLKASPKVFQMCSAQVSCRSMWSIWAPVVWVAVLMLVAPVVENLQGAASPVEHTLRWAQPGWLVLWLQPFHFLMRNQTLPMMTKPAWSNGLRTEPKNHLYGPVLWTGSSPQLVIRIHRRGRRCSHKTSLAIRSCNSLS
ncbi:Uncharacterised protein [Klebsiella variicola]|nr:Uncharacterised protein [Klebsiella variicola]